MNNVKKISLYCNIGALILLIFPLLFLVSFAQAIKLISAYSLLITILYIFLLTKKQGVLFSPANFFMIFLSVFHFGQAWLYFFGVRVDKSLSYDIFYIYPKEKIYTVLLFSVFAFQIISSAMVLFAKNIEKEDAKISFSEEERLKIFKFGLFLFIILIIPVLLYDYRCISIARVYGLRGIYSNYEQVATLGSINSYFPCAIIMLLLGSDPKKNVWKIVYYFAIIRSLIFMIFTGQRIQAVIPLLIYIFCKHYFIKKYEKKIFFLIILVAIVFLSIVSFVAEGRGIYSDMNFFEFVRDKNIITQVLSEFGGTFTTTILSYQYTESFGFLLGKSYLGAFSVFAPFSDVFFAEIKEFMSVSALLNPYSPSKGALGGSLFAEMYINFGWYSLFFAPLLSAFVIKINDIVLGKKQKLIFICLALYTVYGIWVFVRGNMVDVAFSLKSAVYVFLLYFVFADKFFKRGRKS